MRCKTGPGKPRLKTSEEGSNMVGVQFLPILSGTCEEITEFKPVIDGTIGGASRYELEKSISVVEAHGSNKSRGADFEANLIADTVTAPVSSAPTGDGSTADEAPCFSVTPNPPQIGSGMLEDVSVPAPNWARHFVNVNGIWVLGEHAPIVGKIFAKYGDITSGCVLRTPQLLTTLMELVVHVVLLFQQHTGRSFGAKESAFIRDCLSDLELSKFNVEWLKDCYIWALALNEHAKDISEHEALSKQIEEMKAALVELETQCDLVTANMNKRRRIMEDKGRKVDVDKALGADLL